MKYGAGGAEGTWLNVDDPYILTGPSSTAEFYRHILTGRSARLSLPAHSYQAVLRGGFYRRWILTGRSLRRSLAGVRLAQSISPALTSPGSRLPGSEIRESGKLRDQGIVASEGL